MAAGSPRALRNIRAAWSIDCLGLREEQGERRGGVRRAREEEADVCGDAAVFARVHGWWAELMRRVYSCARDLEDERRAEAPR